MSGALSPYGDGVCNTELGFHLTVKLGQDARMPHSAQDIRRKALMHVVKTEYGGNVSAFARRADKPQSQIADMLAGRKRFGEKVARQIEGRAGLEQGVLDIDPDSPRGAHAARQPLAAYGLRITPAEAALGRQWGKLAEPLRTLIEQLVMTLIASQPSGGRSQPSARKAKGNGPQPWAT